MRKKIFTIFILLFILTMSSVFAKEGDVFTIATHGEGSVSATPDMGRVVLSVKNQATDAKIAQKDNARLANEVINAVKSLGISNSDIKTSKFSIYPNYDNNNRKIIGYSAENSITVIIKGIDKVGGVIDSALSAGANQVSSISFYKEDTKSLEKEALTLAVKNAREKAEITAHALNVTIVGVKHASPSINHRAFDASPMLMKSSAQNSATPIEAGSMNVTASVNVEFIIK